MTTSHAPQTAGVPFDETLALEDQTFVGLLAADDRALYDEYVRGFDDVPTLLDPVIVPPPRIVPPEFRLGERKDVRRHAREDVEARRESNVCDLEKMYVEYVAPAAASKPRAGKSKNKKKGRRRKK